MLGGLIDHLWQSTLFAAGAAALTLVLRANGAGARYGLWFAASLKFLVPFALVTTAAGAVAARLSAPSAASPGLAAALQIVEPFGRGGGAPVKTIAAAPASAAPFDPAPALLTAWAIGLVAVLCLWAVRWSRVRAALRASTPMDLAAPIPARASAELLEPALVGVWRPVLLLPEGIRNHLSAAELDAVVAHELCHFRRRDNMTAAIHMLVQALFWFHPLVWWLGARLIDERERACDESVTEAGADPATYAEGILKVCRLYLQSPLAGAAGVSGADLRTRMETILATRARLPLNAPQKLLLASAAVASLAGPAAAGWLAPASATARPRAAAADAYSPALIAARQAEQAEPRKAIAFDPQAFDRFAGSYQLGPSTIFTISRSGSILLSRLTGQPPVEIFPESPTKFFVKVVPAQISFVAGPRGPASGLVLHQNGFERPARRIGDGAARAIETRLQHRIETSQPGPGTEGALRKVMQRLEKGEDVFPLMDPALAAVSRLQMPTIRGDLKRWGRLKSIAFKAVDLQGRDSYTLDFQNGKATALVAPLDADGRISGLALRETP